MKFNVKLASDEPQILVSGMGILPLSMVRSQISKYSDDIFVLSHEQEWRNLEALLSKNVLQSCVKALADYERKLEETAN